MRILRKLAIILVMTTATLAANASILSISEAQINTYLATKLSEKIPLQDKVEISNLFELDYNLHSLTSQIGRTDEKKVAISGIIDCILRVNGKKHDTSININMDSTPYYDSKKGALFLKDVRLLSWSTQPDKYQNKLKMFLPTLTDGLRSFLDNTPVYTLDSSKNKEALIKKFTKSITVKDGSIEVETEIF